MKAKAEQTQSTPGKNPARSRPRCTSACKILTGIGQKRLISCWLGNAFQANDASISHVCKWHSHQDGPSLNQETEEQRLIFKQVKDQAYLTSTTLAIKLTWPHILTGEMSSRHLPTKGDVPFATCISVIQISAAEDRCHVSSKRQTMLHDKDDQNINTSSMCLTTKHVEVDIKNRQHKHITLKTAYTLSPRSQFH